MSARKGKVVRSFSQLRSTNCEPPRIQYRFFAHCSTRILLDSTIMALSDYRNSRGRGYQYCINDSEDIGTRNDCGKLRLLTVAPLPNSYRHIGGPRFDRRFEYWNGTERILFSTVAAYDAGSPYIGNTRYRWRSRTHMKLIPIQWCVSR